MDNIVPFPKTNPKTNAPTKLTEHERKLEQLIKVINYQANYINEAYEALQAMHLELDHTENNFDLVLLDYAKRIGAENVPYKYMQYSKLVVPMMSKEGKIILEIKK